MNNSETSHIDLHPSNKFCLVVDHCDHDYHLLERLFRRREIGLEMKRCTGAVEALKLLNVADYHSAALSKNLPVMIVLDLGSPGNEDGRSVLRTVRGHSVLSHIPVVVFTHSSNPADSAWCYQNGANAYQFKGPDPTSFERVIDLLAKFYKRS
jgi:CheY-like chemotaxis protein